MCMDQGARSKVWTKGWRGMAWLKLCLPVSKGCRTNSSTNDLNVCWHESAKMKDRAKMVVPARQQTE